MLSLIVEDTNLKIWPSLGRPYVMTHTQLNYQPTKTFRKIAYQPKLEQKYTESKLLKGILTKLDTN